MGTKNTSRERAVVLLAAGRGERMRPLTDETPKSMLAVGGVPLLERILEQTLRLTGGEVVVVTGYRADLVERMVERRFAERVRCVRNDRYEEDMNIYSVEVGVNALARPELGYTLIETDLLIEQRGWELLFEGHRGPHSFWLTRGRYGPELIGGIVHADASGRIDAVDYQPKYDPAFDGWHKMVGVVSVSPECVESDRALRRKAIASTVRQYYLMPWKTDIAALPCRVLDLGELFAHSFNTPEVFADTSKAFLSTSKLTR